MNIREVDIRIDVVKHTCCDQLLDPTDALDTKLSPTNGAALFPHLDHSEGSFEILRIHRNLGIGEEDLVPVVSFQRITYGHGKFVRRRPTDWARTQIQRP